MVTSFAVLKLSKLLDSVMPVVFTDSRVYPVPYH